MNGLGETRSLEVLITLRLVTIEWRHSADFLFAHFFSLGLGNTKQHQKILIVWENLQTILQELLSLNELILMVQKDTLSYQVDHCRSSSVITLNEIGLHLDAGQTIGLCLGPVLQTTISHGTVRVKNMVRRI